MLRRVCFGFNFMTKNTNKAVNFWLMSSKDNFKTAEAMLKTGRYNFAMFMCQQTVEAILKAVFIIQKNERPEYIHKLPKLVELTGVKIPKTIDKKILKIDAHYIKARYKEDRFNTKIYNRRSATALLKDTETVIKWFTKKMRLEE
ncbi:MAG: HEPN domain-containing protein [Planctomycetes bacterium]|nr:HEPN domain-containing protein [Planctomycetota bacterium]